MMNERTDKIELALNGNQVQLSNDDIAYIVVELVERIEKLEKKVNDLEGELYAQNNSPEPKMVSSIVDGTKVWYLEGEL